MIQQLSFWVYIWKRKRKMLIWKDTGTHSSTGASQAALVVKNLPADARAGDIGDTGSIPGLGRSPGRGHSNPHQYFAWRIPWTEEPDRLQSIGLHGIVHNWSNRPYGLRVSRDEFKSQNQSLHWKRRNGKETARNIYSNNKRITLDDEKGCRDGESSTKTGLEEPQTLWTSWLPFL